MEEKWIFPRNDKALHVRRERKAEKGKTAAVSPDFKKDRSNKSPLETANESRVLRCFSLLL